MSTEEDKIPAGFTDITEAVRITAKMHDHIKALATLSKELSTQKCLTDVPSMRTMMNESIMPMMLESVKFMRWYDMIYQMAMASEEFLPPESGATRGH